MASMGLDESFAPPNDSPPSANDAAAPVMNPDAATGMAGVSDALANPRTRLFGHVREDDVGLTQVQRQPVTLGSLLRRRSPTAQGVSHLPVLRMRRQETLRDGQCGTAKRLTRRWIPHRKQKAAHMMIDSRQHALRRRLVLSPHRELLEGRKCRLVLFARTVELTERGQHVPEGRVSL